MLKIKDNVDLKKLEKFGFRETDKTFLKEQDLYEEATAIHKDTKAIYLTYYDGRDYYSNTDTLYDLIKADLVEKID